MDRTISNGTVRLGVNAEGHLNVDGYDPSSGGGQTAVGLRFVPENSDAISPGCLCEGWGVWDKASDTVGWANESRGGTQGLELLEASWDERQGVNRTRAGRLVVTHEFEPSASTANLYAIRVRVRNEPVAGSGQFGTADVVYRRVMDWDVEPTAFSEYVTMAAPAGALPGEVITATNDGFASADPSTGASDLGAVGLFEDYGPADTGALVDIRVGPVPFGESRSFLMFYGAAQSETQALSAVSAVGADLYSLAQPDVEGGASTGSPNTFIWGYRSLTPDDGGGPTPQLHAGP